MWLVLRHTSQFLPPDALTLFLSHVQWRGPEMGHDHQELLKADFLNCALNVLTIVSDEIQKGQINYTLRSCGKIRKNLNFITFWRCDSDTAMLTVQEWELGIITVPFVKESFYDLCTDGIACQIRDFIEVLSPDGVKRRHILFRHIVHNCCHMLQVACSDMKWNNRRVSSCTQGWTNDK